MAKKQGVSCKTRTKQQLDDYANQHNPNNKAYKAKVTNQKKMNKRRDVNRHPNYVADLDWMCYSKEMYDLINN